MWFGGLILSSGGLRAKPHHLVETLLLVEGSSDGLGSCYRTQLEIVLTVAPKKITHTKQENLSQFQWLRNEGLRN